MNNRPPIERELQTIAPGLANGPVKMPYTLPPAYFQDLAATILQRAQQASALPTSIEQFSRKMPYQVPDGYFEALAATVLQLVQQQPMPVAEETALLSGLSGQLPYSSPLSSTNPVPAPTTVVPPATVPEGYFEALPERVLAKVRKLEVTRELDEIAPLLNTISKLPVQQVPTGYFENLVAGSKTARRQPAAQVVAIRKKSRWPGYAAACAVFLLGISAFFFFDRGPSGGNGRIVDAKTAATVNIDKQLTGLDEATIEAYLNENGNGTTAAIHFLSAEPAETNNTNLEQLLNSFSDQQLEEHLEESPELPVPPAKKS